MTLIPSASETRIHHLDFENAAPKARRSVQYGLNHRQSEETAHLKILLAQKDAHFEDVELLLTRASKTSSKLPFSDFTNEPNASTSTKPHGAKPGYRGTTGSDAGD